MGLVELSEVSLAERAFPAVTAGPLAEERFAVLLWVHTGMATVEAADTSYRLSAGEAIWVPPGVVHCTRADAGAVVFPILPRVTDLPGVLSQVHVVVIPPGWEDWMIHQYAGNSSARHPVVRGGAVLDLAAAPMERECAAGGAGTLSMPRSPEARGVAHALLSSPGSVLPIERFAARECISTKTLQRQFRRETGMAFSQWRTRARIVTAARHLAEGRNIGAVRREVGYASATAFTTAFQKQLGVLPREYVRLHGSHSPPPSSESSPVKTDEVIQPLDMTEQAVALLSGPFAAPPPIPARQIWDKIRCCNELLYAYRGTSTLRIGTRTCALRSGEAIWVPAGVAYAAEIDEGSLLLTLGHRPGRVRVGVDELTVFSAPAQAETLLLHTMLAEYTLFRPDASWDSLVDELFRAQFVTGRDVRGAGLTGAVGEIAKALRRAPADPRSLGDWAKLLRLSPQQLGQEFLQQTGASFPYWRGRLKMNIARELLSFGDPPAVVSKRLGYASPSAFANAFTSAHGMSPREYQRREQ